MRFSTEVVATLKRFEHKLLDIVHKVIVLRERNCGGIRRRMRF